MNDHNQNSEGDQHHKNGNQPGPNFTNASNRLAGLLYGSNRAVTQPKTELEK